MNVRTCHLLDYWYLAIKDKYSSWIRVFMNLRLLSALDCHSSNNIDIVLIQMRFGKSLSGITYLILLDFCGVCQIVLGEACESSEEQYKRAICAPRKYFTSRKAQLLKTLTESQKYNFPLIWFCSATVSVPVHLLKDLSSSLHSSAPKHHQQQAWTSTVHRVLAPGFSADMIGSFWTQDLSVWAV